MLVHLCVASHYSKTHLLVEQGDLKIDDEVMIGSAVRGLIGWRQDGESDDGVYASVHIAKTAKTYCGPIPICKGSEAFIHTAYVPMSE